MPGFLLSYRACYPICDTGEKPDSCECKRQLPLSKEQVIPLQKQIGLYEIQTPKETDGYYPDYTICTYSLMTRKFNHQFSYIFSTIPFDFEKSETIPGACDDCMEFEHRDTETRKDIKLIQCGKRVDRRLNKGGGTLSNIELTFKSDPPTPGAHFSGADFYLAESAVSVSLCS